MKKLISETLEDTEIKRTSIPSYKFDNNSNYTIKVNKSEDVSEIINDINIIVKEKKFLKGYNIAELPKEEDKSVVYLLDINEKSIEYIDSFDTLQITDKNTEKYKYIAYDYYSGLKKNSYGFEIIITPCFEELGKDKHTFNYYIVEKYGIYETRDEAIEALFYFRKNKWDKRYCKKYYKFNQINKIDKKCRIISDFNVYDDSGNIIPESEEVIMYKEQHKRTDPESIILRELEKKYSGKILTMSEMFELFEEYKTKLKVSTQKEVHRLLIHFCGDQFSQICTYEDLWDEDYPVENDSYLMELERLGIKTFLRKDM